MNKSAHTFGDFSTSFILLFLFSQGNRQIVHLDKLSPLVNPERCAGQVICLFAFFIHSHSINLLISLIYSRFSLTWESRKSRIWEMKEDKYTKSLAKNQVHAIVHMRSIRKNVLPKFIKLCMEMTCLCPFQAHKYGHWKPTETSVFELSCSCMNSLLEELIKIEVIFILRQEMYRLQNLQKSVMFLTHIRAFPAASQMRRHAKAWKFKHPVLENKEPF